MNWFWRTFLILILGGSAAWGCLAYWKSNQKTASPYRTVALKRGELVSTISATGTLEPEEVIDVGAQVAGQIVEFGKDAKLDKPIDYRSTVKEGAILAKIDDTVYQAALDSAKAQKDQAIAGIVKAEADLKQMQAKEVQASRDWNRAQQAEKAGAGVLAQADMDAYKAAYDSAVATVALGEAAVTVARKQETQAEAAQSMAQRNLDFCTIKSPVDGTIIDRRVNKGQTVVASLNAPSLFLIAKDLTRMQVWASVNEADISNIHDGQKVTFTVDAIPGRTFDGSVNKVRLNATMNQNVVTYTVEITTQNKDLALLPYLTANVLFEVARKNDTLLAPNAALRWTPASEELIAPEARSALAAHGTKPPGPTDPTEGPKPKKQEHQRHGFIWVEDGNYVKPIRVTTALTDGTNTEIIPDEKDKAELKEGLAVITGEASPDENAGDVSNPFVPKFKRKR